MVSERARTLVCAAVGVIAGIVLGPPFVPGLTGVLAGALAVIVTLAVGGGLYTAWGRSGPWNE